MSELYIGLMSGTSLDGIDAALVDFSHHPLKLICTHTEPLDPSLKQSLLDLCQPGANEIDRMGEIDVTFGELLAQSCVNLLRKAQVSPTQIAAIGSHGQTIRHRPATNVPSTNVPSTKVPFTLQIGNPHCIAMRTQITTVADFRRRDMVWGGQGAPLAPAFHEFLFRNTEQDCWVLNIGGMANLTFLSANSNDKVTGFDTGPGNTLLDAWCALHTSQAFDRDGQMAAQGQVHPPLLQLLLADAYFKRVGPKSTGREHFNLEWLQQALESLHAMTTMVTETPISSTPISSTPISSISSPPSPSSPSSSPPLAADVQATLVELTAQTIATAILNKSTNIWVCGGGFHNKVLMERLQKLCHPAKLISTEQVSIGPDWIEAVAFAWLARQTLTGRPGNLTDVTGAARADILGAIYPVIKS